MKKEGLDSVKYFYMHKRMTAKKSKVKVTELNKKTGDQWWKVLLYNLILDMLENHSFNPPKYLLYSEWGSKLVQTIKAMDIYKFDTCSTNQKQSLQLVPYWKKDLCLTNLIFLVCGSKEWQRPKWILA